VNNKKTPFPCLELHISKPALPHIEAATPVRNIPNSLPGMVQSYSGKLLEYHISYFDKQKALAPLHLVSKTARLPSDLQVQIVKNES
jgi:hypothetical protein